MMRNFGYLILVVFSAAAWATVAILLVAAEIRTDTEGAFRSALVVGAAAGLFAFYFAGYVYVLLTGSRSLLSGALVGVLLGVVLYVLISLATPNPDPEAQTNLKAWLSVLAMPICLSVLGGWVADRRNTALSAGSAGGAGDDGGEPTADSSLRSE